MKVQLEGFKELGNFFKEMGKKPGQRIMRKALKPASTRMNEALTSAAPIATGALIRSVEMRPKSSRSYGNVSYEVRGNYYWRFIEFGHVVRWSKDAPAVGFVPPRPIIRPLFERMRQSMEKQVLDVLEQEVTKAWKRHVKKTTRGK